MHKAGYQQHGFTIVELLVVIVVIGILAAITVVSYTGISQKAIVAMLQSDLTNSVPRLKMYQVEHGAFPATLDTASNCPTGPADTNYCLKPSSGNTFAYSSSSPYSTFTLTATNTNGTSYRITDNTGPVNVTTTPITAIAAITGTPQVDQVLTAGALTPSGATASYQWQSSAASGGTYTNISGATSSTYTLVSSDVGNYLEVVATGTGSYSGSATSAATTIVPDPNWIAGLVGTPMEGKFVYYRDINSTDAPAYANTLTWGPNPGSCVGPQCALGIDPNYTSMYSLVADNGVDFTSYPARNACKSLGGRLPNMKELTAIYAGNASYGNNFQTASYWSATEEDTPYARVVYFFGYIYGGSKSNGSRVRCVR